MIVDKAKAIEILEEVVAEKGADYVYPEPNCHYAVDGKPSCIAGYGAVRLGVPVEVLDDVYGVLLDGDPSDEFSLQTEFLDAMDANGFEFTPEAAIAWRAAQKVQDGCEAGSKRGTWGEALEAARNAA